MPNIVSALVFVTLVTNQAVSIPPSSESGSRSMQISERHEIQYSVGTNKFNTIMIYPMSTNVQVMTWQSLPTRPRTPRNPLGNTNINIMPPMPGQ